MARRAGPTVLPETKAHGRTISWLADNGQRWEDALPSLAAAIAASLAGWILDGLFEQYLGMGATLVLSFVVSTLTFFYVRRWLVELRGR